MSCGGLRRAEAFRPPVLHDGPHQLSERSLERQGAGGPDQRETPVAGERLQDANRERYGHAQPGLALVARRRAQKALVEQAFQRSSFRRERNGDKAFCVFNERSWTWREFDNAVGRLTAVLQTYGVKRGDRVGIVARNHVAHVMLLLACARLSAIMVPVNPDFGQSEAEYVLHNADISGLVVDSETRDVALPLTKRV